MGGGLVQRQGPAGNAAQGIVGPGSGFIIGVGLGEFIARLIVGEPGFTAKNIGDGEQAAQFVVGVGGDDTRLVGLAAAARQRVEVLAQGAGIGQYRQGALIEAVVELPGVLI